MAKKNLRNWTKEKKLSILKDHLINGVSVSDLCDKHKLQPSVYYCWQKTLFEEGSLERRKNQHNEDMMLKKADKKIARLEAKLQQKDSVVAELLHEHITLKKSFNGEN